MDYSHVWDGMCLHFTGHFKALCVEGTTMPLVTTVAWAWDFRKDTENRWLVYFSS